MNKYYSYLYYCKTSKRYFRVQNKEEVDSFSKDCIFIKVTEKKESCFYDLSDMNREGFKIVDYSSIKDPYENTKENIALCNSYQYRFRMDLLIEQNFNFDNKVLYFSVINSNLDKFYLQVTDSIFSVPVNCYYAAALPFFSIQYSIDKYKSLHKDSYSKDLVNSCIEFNRLVSKECKAEYNNNNINKNTLENKDLNENKQSDNNDLNKIIKSNINDSVYLHSFIKLVSEQVSKYKEKGSSCFDFRTYSVFNPDYEFDAGR